MGDDSDALTYVDRGMQSVEGWFDDTEARAFIAVSRAQVDAGTTGDLLEIGAYLGKSAILLGFLVGASEELVVSDLFGIAAIDDENRDEMERFYESYTLDGFHRNFARFHDRPPIVLRGPSSRTLPARPDASCRIVHVDGSHVFEAVRSDIAQTRRLLRPGGIAIFDDMFAVHAPGVQAAVWEAVSNGLVPIAIGTKLYGSWTPEQFDREGFVDQMEEMEGLLVVGTNAIRGHEVIEFTRDPSWRLPSKLRCGVELLTPPVVPRLAEAFQQRRHAPSKAGGGGRTPAKRA